MKRLKSIQNELQLLGARKKLLGKREVQELANVMHQDENILGFIHGLYQGGLYALLVMTNKRVIFVLKTPTNLVIDDILYNMVASLEYNIGIFWGKVELFARHKNYSFTFVNKAYIMPFAHIVEDVILKQAVRR